MQDIPPPPQHSTFCLSDTDPAIGYINPSPAYIQRVWLNGEMMATMLEGNLAAVVKAILLDPEARNVMV